MPSSIFQNPQTSSMDIHTTILNFATTIGLLDQPFIDALLTSPNHEESGFASLLVPMLLFVQAALANIFYFQIVTQEPTIRILSHYVDSIEMPDEKTKLRKALSLSNIQHIECIANNRPICLCSGCGFLSNLFAILCFLSMVLLCTIPLVFPGSFGVYYVGLHLFAFNATFVWLNWLSNNAVAVAMITYARKFSWLDRFLFSDFSSTPIQTKNVVSTEEVWGLETSEKETKEATSKNTCGAPNFESSPPNFCPLWKHCAACTEKRKFLVKHSLMHSACLACDDLKACSLFNESEFMLKLQSSNALDRPDFKCKFQTSAVDNKKA